MIAPGNHQVPGDVIVAARFCLKPNENIKQRMGSCENARKSMTSGF
jgi:hypothetical protein